MYQHRIIEDLIETSEAAAVAPVYRFGITMYVECDPDISGADIYIDPEDEEGVRLAREFCLKMAEHYRKIKEIHNSPVRAQIHPNDYIHDHDPDKRRTTN